MFRNTKYVHKYNFGCATRGFPRPSQTENGRADKPQNGGSDARRPVSAEADSGWCRLQLVMSPTGCLDRERKQADPFRDQLVASSCPSSLLPFLPRSPSQHPIRGSDPPYSAAAARRETKWARAENAARTRARLPKSLGSGERNKMDAVCSSVSRREGSYLRFEAVTAMMCVSRCSVNA